MNYRNIVTGVFGSMLLCAFASAAEQSAGIGLTIYNDNFAVVKERRQMDFAQGQNTVKFADVATAIDPTTVSFECISSPGDISILEQNYEFDLANTDALLKKYIDKDVELVLKGSGATAASSYWGKLISSQDQNIILQTKHQTSQGKFENAGLVLINKNELATISLSEAPADLLTKPTLVWLAQSNAAGSQLCQIAYTTDAINWKADYKAILDVNSTSLDLSGWVSIDNKSGIGYRDAQIKLVAGNVRRIRRAQPMYDMAMPMRMMKSEAQAAGFEEKPFMEYHLYTLGRTSTINNNEVKQIELIEPANKVPVEKLLVYERQQKPDKVQVKLEFKNTKKNHLGIALPKGKVRVFSRDPADNGLEFIGEDEIDHTARNEKLSLYIGDAFDVVPQYTLLDSRVGNNTRRDVHKIELRNRKDVPVTVRVDEKFPAWVNWEVLDATHQFEKHDAQTARFKIDIPADANVTLQYTATQTWF